MYDSQTQSHYTVFKLYNLSSVPQKTRDWRVIASGRRYFTVARQPVQAKPTDSFCRALDLTRSAEPHHQRVQRELFGQCLNKAREEVKGGALKNESIQARRGSAGNHSLDGTPLLTCFDITAFSKATKLIIARTVEYR